MSETATPLGFRSDVPPTADQWLAIKPIFIRLYLDEDKKLDVVRLELAKYYGFFAPEAAYKRRINEWKAFKNYKAREKEKLAQHQSWAHSSDSCGIELRVHGKPVKWHRVHRYKRTQVSRQPSSTKSVPLPAKRPRLRDVQSAPGILRSSPIDAEEAALRAARDFHRWTMSTSCIAKRPGKDFKLSNVVFEATQAIKIMANTSSKVFRKRTWRCLNDVCRTLPNLIDKNGEFEVFRTMIDLVSEPFPPAVYGAAESVFGYFVSMSLEYLHSDSPLRQLLELLKTRESVSTLLPQLAELQYDIVLSNPVGPNDVCDIFCFMDSVAALSGMGHAETALKLLEKISTSDLSDDIQRLELQVNKAYATYTAKDLKSSILQYSKCLEMATACNQQRIALECHDIMANCHLRLGNLEQAIRFMKSRLQCALHLENGEMECVHVLGDLIRILQKNKRYDDMRQVMHEFGYILHAHANDDTSSAEGNGAPSTVSL